MVNVERGSIPVSYPWYKVWRQVLFHPSVRTFEDILHDPNARARRSILWVGLSALFVAVMYVLLYHLLSGIYLTWYENAGLLIGIPILAMITFFILTGGYHLTGKLFDGQGTYQEMIYACGGFFAPIFIVSSAIGGVWFLAVFGLLMSVVPGISQILAIGSGSVLCCLTPLLIGLAVFSAIESVLAIKAVKQLPTGKAFLSWLIPALVFVIVSAVLRSL